MKKLGSDRSGWARPRVGPFRGSTAVLGSFRFARPGLCPLRHLVDLDQRHAGGGDLRRLDLRGVGTGF